MFLKKFFLRRRHDKEFAREIDHYIEVETADNLDRGMNADEARAAAIRKFGNQVRYREEAWDMNTLQFADTAWRDTVHGLRQLKRSPGFAVTAVLSLAVGIGANTTIFQLLDTIARRSLPVADPAGLAQVKVEGGHRGLGASSGDYQATYPLWEQVRQNQQAFSGVFAWGVNFWDLGQPGQDRVRGLYATGGMFATLGVRPYRGRLFDDTDDRKDAPLMPAFSAMPCGKANSAAAAMR